MMKGDIYYDLKVNTASSLSPLFNYPSFESNEENLVLLVDDKPEIGRGFERLVATLDNRSVRVHRSRDEKGALKKVKQNTYKIVFVDLRLSPNNAQGGLDLLESLAPAYPEIPFILFTSNPYDAVIEARIAQANEKEENFLLFVGNKADTNTLFEILKKYLETTPHPIINYDIIPSSLLEKLQNIGKTLWDKEVNRAYEYGQLLFQAKEAIELRRQELKEKIADLQPQTESERKEKKQLEDEYQEISKLWSSWLSPYVNLSCVQINTYVNYYKYFSDPHHKPYQKGIDLNTFTELTRKKFRGKRKNNPYVLSEQDQKYLLEIASHQALNSDTVAKYVKVKKEYPSLSSPLIYRICQENQIIISQLLKRLTTSELSAQEIERRLAQSHRQEIREQLEEALSVSESNLIEITQRQSSPTPQWQDYPYYTLFKGTWQQAIAAKSLNIGCVIIDQALAWKDASLISHLVEQKKQIIMLPDLNPDDFEYMFEDIIERIKPYLPQGKVLVFYILTSTFEKINLTLEAWQNERLTASDNTYVDGRMLLDELSKTKEVYLIIST